MLRIGTTLLVLCQASGAFAQTPDTSLVEGQTESIHLKWEAPTACPNAAYVQEAILRQIAQTKSAVPPRPFIAHVKVQQLVRGPFQAIVTFHSQAVEGERVLEVVDCALLADATAMLIALVATRDDQAVVLNTASAVVPPAAPQPLVDLPQPQERSIAPFVSQRPSFTIVTGAYGQVVEGRAPTALLGGAFAVGVGWRSARVEAMAEVSSSRDSSLQSVEQGFATFRSWGGGLRGCYGWGWRDWELAPCITGKVVRIEGEAAGGPIKSSSSVSTELEGWVGVEGRWHVGWLEPVIGAEIGGPASRHRYVVRSIDDGAAVWRFETKPMRLCVRLGLALHF